MKLLTTKQVAEILQVTPARVYEMSRLKLLPVVRLGRQVRFNEEVLSHWIAVGGQESPSNSYSESNNISSFPLQETI